MTTTPWHRDLTPRDGVSRHVDHHVDERVDREVDREVDRAERAGRRGADWRGEFFRALFDTLSNDEQRWVLDRIAAYASLNAELGDPARI